MRAAFKGVVGSDNEFPITLYGALPPLLTFKELIRCVLCIAMETVVIKGGMCGSCGVDVMLSMYLRDRLLISDLVSFCV